MLLISTGERNVLESLLGTVEQQIGAQGVRRAHETDTEFIFFLTVWTLQPHLRMYVCHKTEFFSEIT